MVLHKYNKICLFPSWFFWGSLSWANLHTGQLKQILKCSFHISPTLVLLTGGLMSKLRRLYLGCSFPETSSFCFSCCRRVSYLPLIQCFPVVPSSVWLPRHSVQGSQWRMPRKAIYSRGQTQSHSSLLTHCITCLHG